jgi:hypothetical protein
MLVSIFLFSKPCLSFAIFNILQFCSMSCFYLLELLIVRCFGVGSTMSSFASVDSGYGYRSAGIASNGIVVFVLDGCLGS